MLRKFQGDPWSLITTLRMSASFLMTLSQVGFLTLASSSKVTVYNSGDVRDIGLIPVFGRSPEGGHGNPLQYSCLENPYEQKSLEGYSPCGCKESEMTEWLSTAHIMLSTNLWKLNFRLVDAAAAATKSLQSCPTLWPHRWQPTRLPRPWDSPGKNIDLWATRETC